jgi:hypothetical protein
MTLPLVAAAVVVVAVEEVAVVAVFPAAEVVVIQVAAVFPVAAPPRAAVSRPVQEVPLPPRPELLAARRQLRLLQPIGLQPLRRRPRTGPRLSRAVNQLRQPIRPSGSNTQAKTSRSARKDTRHGQARANKDTPTGRKRGMKPRSNTMEEDMVTMMTTMIITTGTTVKSRL